MELELTENRQKQEELSTKIDNATTYVDQLEKQCIKKKEDLEHLHQKKLPVVKKAKDDKIYINNVYAKKIKMLEREKTRNTTNAQKTKKVTIKAFFKKEKQDLSRQLTMIQKEMVKNQKEPFKNSVKQLQNFY